jgi:hypothetical protein
VVDGFWAREAWVEGDLKQDVDDLPLCCVETIATAAYLLREAGLVVERRGWLERVNRLAAAAEPGATRRCPRYAVVARKLAGS